MNNMRFMDSALEWLLAAIPDSQARVVYVCGDTVRDCLQIWLEENKGKENVNYNKLDADFWKERIKQQRILKIKNYFLPEKLLMSKYAQALSQALTRYLEVKKA